MPREYQFNFELRHLVYFRQVAEELHFRRAAETLAVAQPALSRQIAQLEKSFGAALFTRTRRRVELTEAGQLLFERLEPLLRSLKSLPEELHALARGQTGRLRVGFTGLAMATVLPGLLREFCRQFPAIRLELNESPTATHLKELPAGDLACGLFHPDTAIPAIKTRLFLREKNGAPPASRCHLPPTGRPRPGKPAGAWLEDGFRGARTTAGLPTGGLPDSPVRHQPRTNPS